MDRDPVHTVLSGARGAAVVRPEALASMRESDARGVPTKGTCPCAAGEYRHGSTPSSRGNIGSSLLARSTIRSLTSSVLAGASEDSYVVVDFMRRRAVVVSPPRDVKFEVSLLKLGGVAAPGPQRATYLDFPPSVPGSYDAPQAPSSPDYPWRRQQFTQQPPWCGVGAISSGGNGTGFQVGPRTVMTNGHVLLNAGAMTFEAAVDQLVNQVPRYYAGYNGATIYPVVNMCAVAFPAMYANLWNMLDRDKHDYAFGFLAGQPQPYEFWFGLATGNVIPPIPDTPYTVYNKPWEVYIHQMGYPSCQDGVIPTWSCANDVQLGMYGSEVGCGRVSSAPFGHDQDPNGQPRKFQTECPAAGGASGSPGFVVVDEHAWAIGMATDRSGDKASHLLFTDAILDHFVLAKSMFESDACSGLSAGSLP